MNPSLIRDVVRAISDSRVIDAVPADCIVVATVGSFSVTISSVPIDNAPSGLYTLRRDRSTTSLPIVFVERASGRVLRVDVLRWDEPRVAPVPIRINSPGGVT